MNNHGTLSLNMALLFVLFSSASLLAIGNLAHWKSVVRLQIDLDQCVFHQATNLKNSLIEVQSINTTIHSLRALLASAGTFEPASIPALKAALDAATVSQKIIVAAIEVQVASWNSQISCAGVPGLRKPITLPPWIRPPPDLLGPQALHLEKLQRTPISISIYKAPRISNAEVIYEKTEKFSKEHWLAHWRPSHY